MSGNGRLGKGLVIAPEFGLPNNCRDGLVVSGLKVTVTGATTMVDDGAGFVAATLAAAACDDFLVTALKNPNSCNFLSISSSLC